RVGGFACQFQRVGGRQLRLELPVVIGDDFEHAIRLHDPERHASPGRYPTGHLFLAHRTRVDGRLLVLERASWQALGTSVHVLVERGDLATACTSVSTVLEEVDRPYSRSRSDSELTTLPRN